jgi:hypothetical protein
MGEPALVEEPSVPRPPLWSPIALLALVGAGVAIAGVFLPWAEPTRITLRGEDFLAGLSSGFGLGPVALPATGLDALALPVAGLSVRGRSDLLGLGAALAGFSGVVGALLAAGMPEDRWRRIGGLVAALAGVGVIALAAVAWSDTGGMVVEEVVAQVRAEASQQLEAFIPDIPFSGLITGPLLARVEASLVASVDVEAHAATGLFVSLGGGAVAALGGLVVVVREMPAEADPTPGSLAATVAQMSAQDREDLLRVLSSPDEVRAEAVRTFTEQPGKASWSAFLSELERNPRIRHDVVRALRDAERPRDQEGSEPEPGSAG